MFDTNFTADLTIMEEGHEFIRRVKEGGTLPMFTSCCPGWINLVEKSYPRLLPHLSTCKSPQGMMGTLIKTFFAQKLGVSPENIVNVSIMPCVAKKDEIARPQLTTQVPNPDGSRKRIPDTDYVLTTREIGHLIERERVSASGGHAQADPPPPPPKRSPSSRCPTRTTTVPSASPQEQRRFSVPRAVFWKRLCAPQRRCSPASRWRSSTSWPSGVTKASGRRRSRWAT